jgi:hypothetical protein
MLASQISELLAVIERVNRCCSDARAALTSGGQAYWMVFILYYISYKNLK